MAYRSSPLLGTLLYKHADGTFELYEEKVHGPNIWVPEEEAEQTVEASISLEIPGKVGNPF